MSLPPAQSVVLSHVEVGHREGLHVDFEDCSLTGHVVFVTATVAGITARGGRFLNRYEYLKQRVSQVNVILCSNV
jgi:hypothetical protein